MIAGRRLVVLLTARQAGVLDWRPGNMHWLGDFPTTSTGVAAFQQLLSRHRRPVRIILDSVDEDYRLEILPQARGRAREEMLQRKLKQIFRNAAFIGAWHQKRESEGRRDDRYLLAAATDADWLKPWLGAIDDAQAPLEGITLLSMACQSLLKRLRIREAHTLLAYRLGSGLRLSYYQDGLLRFSRLLSGETPTQGPGWAAEEISKTQLYLMGQRMLSREARLQVLLVDPSGSLDTALAPLNADPAFHARSLDTALLARALRMPDEFIATTPEIAPLAAIAGEPLLLNLAPGPLTQRHTEYRWQRGIRMAALMVGVIGVLFTGLQWLRTLERNDETSRLLAEQRQLEARYRDITRAFPPAPVSAEELGETIALAAQIERGGANPLPAFRMLSLVLEDQPAIVLKKIRWQDAALATPPVPGERRITVDATLGTFDGNYRVAMEQIARFMAELQKLPGVVRVELTRSPVNTDSSAALIGNTRAGSTPSQAEFALDVRYREGAR